MSKLDLSTIRDGGSDCPSDFALDAWHAGEASPESHRELEAHVKHCASCDARVSLRKQGFAAFPSLDERPIRAALRQEAQRPAGRGRWRIALGLGVGALALAASVSVITRASSPSIDTDGTRLKGSPVLHVYRESDGVGREVLSGSQFSPGDRLRFTIDLAQAARVRVYGQEASGSLYVAWPIGTATNDSFQAGQALELEGAVVLDTSTGVETLWLVTCEASHEPQCTASGGNELNCPAGCQRSAFVMRKTQ